ncbi:MAG: GerMN domain-containing protein [Sporomusaceae bacterium]|nr:GerMN domain-containing protein [Sporomusaceae bacterium]
MKRYLILALFVIFPMLLLTGCDNSQSAATTSTSGANASTDAAKTPVQPVAAGTPIDSKLSYVKFNLYFPSDDGAHLVMEPRTFPLNDQPAHMAVEALLTGSNQPHTAKVFPAGTKLRQLTIKDGVAYVDFNKALLKGNGGSATEMLLVTSLVNTLTEFSTVDKVQILVEGKKIDTLYGHMDLSVPLSRSESIVKK